MKEDALIKDAARQTTLYHSETEAGSHQLRIAEDDAVSTSLPLGFDVVTPLDDAHESSTVGQSCGISTGGKIEASDVRDQTPSHLERNW